jgi:RNA polymerase sigma-70 factor (ECF subfamily)
VTQLEDRERRERLELKLAELREEHRAVLVLRDLEGLPYEEIAAVTRTPVGSVKGRLHRARNELIEIMRNNSYDWELPDGR